MSLKYRTLPQPTVVVDFQITLKFNSNLNDIVPVENEDYFITDFFGSVVRAKYCQLR